MSERLPIPPVVSERPRERLLRHGTDALTSAELLAVILGTGLPGTPVLDFAHALLRRFGGVRPLLAASAEELGGVAGMGAARICQLAAILALARRALEEDLARDCLLDHPVRVKSYCTALLGHEQIERCVALFLDNQYRLIVAEEVSRGTLTQTSVYPRELVKAGLRHHAAALILVHNHPSGLARPSQADVDLTRQARQALQMVDIHLLDHLVVAANRVVSMDELGLI
ncbi:MAG: DNA repair protein RadC [Burkholderiaceae bacterium]|jgi:DNA repair protein RadC|nr:DNA repair protein RadC [Burkholderiaceae bacterium]